MCAARSILRVFGEWNAPTIGASIFRPVLYHTYDGAHTDADTRTNIAAYKITYAIADTSAYSTADAGADRLPSIRVD